MKISNKDSKKLGIFCVCLPFIHKYREIDFAVNIFPI